MKIQIKSWSWAVIAAASLVCSAFPLKAAVNIYLNFPGIKGEVATGTYAQQIEVNSLSGGISNVVTVTGSGVSVGKPVLTDIVITKPLDSASTPLYLACAQGTQTRNVVFTMTKSTGASNSEIAFYTLTMGSVVVKSIQTSVSGGTPMETVVLTCTTTMQWSYTPVNPDGTLATPIVHTWNIATNTGS